MPSREDQIIEKYFAPLSEGDPAARGLRDDTASIKITGDEFSVLTMDTTIAGVHFFAHDAPEDIAWKALAVNVSDLIASGATPRHYLLSLSLNDQTDDNWLSSFAKGLKTAQETFKLHLIGGDTTRTTGPLSITITALGGAPQSGYTSRVGARPGDLVFVTGTIGDGYLGCALRRDDQLAAGFGLSDNDKKFLVGRYLRPRPRLKMIPAVRQFASACMDISDGLILDFERLARASNCGGRIIADDVPLSDPAGQVLAAQPDERSRLLTAGDDYELLLTIPPENSKAFLAAAGNFDFAVTLIGTCIKGPSEIECRTASGEILNFERSGYDHFQTLPNNKR